MLNCVPGLAVLGCLACVSCGTTDGPGAKKELQLLPSDLRIGLTADDQAGAPARIEGEGFERLKANTYVFSSTGPLGAGRLSDGEGVWAAGHPASLWDLRGQVFAREAAAGNRSDAQVVELVVSDLEAEERAPETRLVIESVLRARIGENAVAMCKVQAGLSYEGTSMARVESTYSLYGLDGGERVEIYRGVRGRPGSLRLAVVVPGEPFRVTDPSFFVDLAPGIYVLEFSMSAHATAPTNGANVLISTGAFGFLEAESRLRIE